MGKTLTIWNLYVGAIEFTYSSIFSNLKFSLVRLLWYAINCMVVILYLYSLLEIEFLPKMTLACIVQFEYALRTLETNQPSAKIQNVIYYTKCTAGNRCVQQLTTNSISYMQTSRRVHAAYMLWHISCSHHFMQICYVIYETQTLYILILVAR